MTLKKAKTKGSPALRENRKKKSSNMFKPIRLTLTVKINFIVSYDLGKSLEQGGLKIG